MVFLTPDQFAALLAKLSLPHDLESVVVESGATGVVVSVWNKGGICDRYIIDRTGGIKRA